MSRSKLPTARASRRRAVAFAACLAVVGAGCGESGSESAPTTTEATLGGVVRDPTPSVADISLPNVSDGGKPMAFVGPPNGLLIVYFGYTSCPDVCPTTLADLKAALKKTGEDADRVQVAMATIDPRRDTAEVLDGYVKSFFPTAIALRAKDDAQLQAATDALGVSYQTDYSDPANPEVAHSGYLYAIDADGNLRVQWAFGTTANDLAADIELLLSDQAADPTGSGAGADTGSATTSSMKGQ
jgi:protein SCO1/2